MKGGMWTWSDLDPEELRSFAAQECECKPESETGTRNGFTCAAHQARAEIERRILALARLRGDS